MALTCDGSADLVSFPGRAPGLVHDDLAGGGPELPSGGGGEALEQSADLQNAKGALRGSAVQLELVEEELVVLSPGRCP